MLLEMELYAYRVIGSNSNNIYISIYVVARLEECPSASYAHYLQ